MKRTHRVFLLPLLGGLTLAAACSDSKDGPLDPGNGAGTMSFTYSGDVSGSFSASGALPSGNPEGKTWAAAMLEDDGTLGVGGSRSLGGNRYDYAEVWLPQSAPGTYSIVEDCVDENCAVVYVEFAWETGENADFGRSCELLTGSITVASFANNRVKGSFSGAGECISPDDEGGVIVTEISVTNGQFDTAVHR